jgi:hypothetical protein
MEKQLPSHMTVPRNGLFCSPILESPPFSVSQQTLLQLHKLNSQKIAPTSTLQNYNGESSTHTSAVHMKTLTT